MKHLILIAALSLCISIASSAQVIIRAGLTRSQYEIVDDNNTTIDYTYNKVTGFMMGVAYPIRINKTLTLQPELLFQQKGQAVHQEYSTGIDYVASLDEVIKVNFIEVPLYFNWSFGNDELKFNLGTGISIGYAVSGTYQFNYSENYFGSTYTINEEGKIIFSEKPDNYSGYATYFSNRIDLNFLFGAGLTIKNKIILDVRYCYSNLNIQKGGDEDSASNKLFQFSIGMPLNLKRQK